LSLKKAQAVRRRDPPVIIDHTNRRVLDVLESRESWRAGRAGEPGERARRGGPAGEVRGRPTRRSDGSHLRHGGAVRRGGAGRLRRVGAGDRPTQPAVNAPLSAVAVGISAAERMDRRQPDPTRPALGGYGPNRETASWTEAINQITTDSTPAARAGCRSGTPTTPHDPHRRAVPHPVHSGTLTAHIGTRIGLPPTRSRGGR
jgi:hypothetical protein